MNEKEQAMQKSQGAGNSMMNRLAECPTTGTNCCVLFNGTKRGQHAGL